MVFATFSSLAIRISSIVKSAGPLAILPDEMRIIGENKNFRSALGIDPENSVIIAGKDHAIVKPESVNNSVPDASYNKILDISESVKKRATDKEPLLKGADHIRKELLAGNLELEIRPTFATAKSSPQEQIKEKYKLAIGTHREAEKEPIKPNKSAPSPKQ